jgi:hypothetical protein
MDYIGIDPAAVEVSHIRPLPLCVTRGDADAA